MIPKCLAALSASVLFVALPMYLRAQSTTVTGVSRAANPAISANVLYLAAVSLGDSEVEGEHAEGGDEHGEEAPGANVQELELRLTSFVDPHVKADITLSTHGIAEAEVEEAFVTALGLPANMGLKAGKFLAAFGKQRYG